MTTIVARWAIQQLVVNWRWLDKMMPGAAWLDCDGVGARSGSEWNDVCAYGWRLGRGDGFCSHIKLNQIDPLHPY